MRKNYGMKKRVTTAYNPQANGIIERVHLVLADALRTFELQEREKKTLKLLFYILSLHPTWVVDPDAALL
jgi:transposase InsO family protein